jgi:hypothetical protein
MEYDNNAMYRRHTFWHWIKLFKTVMVCHYLFSNVITSPGIINAFNKDTSQLNHTLHMIINSHVERPKGIYVAHVIESY